MSAVSYGIIHTVIAVCSEEQTAISQIVFQQCIGLTNCQPCGDYSAGVSAGASAGFSAEGIAAGNSGAGASVSIFSV